MKILFNALLIFVSLNFANAQLGVVGGLLKKKDKAAPAAKEVTTNGISGPVHQKNLNKIVFASTAEALKFGAETESSFSNKFVLGEPIYLRVYMDNSLTNFVQKLVPERATGFINVYAKYKMKFFLDNKEAYTAIEREGEFKDTEKETWTTFKGALRTANNESNSIMRMFRNFISEKGELFTTGDHTLRLEISPYIDYPDVKEGAVVATGEITLTVKANAFDPNDDKICLPKAQLTDKIIEAGMLKAFNAQGYKENGKEARIADASWTIVRNENTGIILKRVIDGIIASTKDGKCIYQTFGFSQDYDGSKFLNEIRVDNVGSQKTINCKCLRQ